MGNRKVGEKLSWESTTFATWGSRVQSPSPPPSFPLGAKDGARRSVVEGGLSSFVHRTEILHPSFLIGRNSIHVSDFLIYSRDFFFVAPRPRTGTFQELFLPCDGRLGRSPECEERTRRPGTLARGGFHSATLAAFARSLPLRSAPFSPSGGHSPSAS